MKRISFHLLLLALLLLPAAPALARLVVGVSPAVTPGANERGTLDECARLLSERTSEIFYFRSISDEAQLIDWLVRFRELDAALITPKAFASHPGGDLVKVAEFPGDKGAALIVVTYAGQSAGSSQLLRVLPQLAGTEPGQRLLQRPLALAAPVDTPLSQPLGAVAPPREEPAQPAARPVERTPDPLPSPAPVAKSALAPVVATPAAPSEPTAVVTQTSPTATIQPAPGRTEPPATAAVTVSAIPPPASTPTPAANAAPPTKKSRLAMLVAVILGTGILLKLALLIRHWRQKRNQSAPPPTPATFVEAPTCSAPVTPPAREDRPAAPDLFAPFPSTPPPAPKELQSLFPELPDLPSKWEAMILPPVLPPLPTGEDHAAWEESVKSSLRQSNKPQTQ